MSNSLNQVHLIGNLCSDPEVRTFQNGGKVCNLRLATNESWKGSDGQKQERTEFHTVAIFNGGLAGVAERYLRRGSRIYLEGQLRTRRWQDKDGMDRYSTEVVLRGPNCQIIMLDSAHGVGEQRDDREETHGHAGGGGYDDLDDSIPF